MSHPDQMKMIPAQIEMIQFDAASTDSILVLKYFDIIRLDLIDLIRQLNLIIWTTVEYLTFRYHQYMFVLVRYGSLFRFRS